MDDSGRRYQIYLKSRKDPIDVYLASKVLQHGGGTSATTASSTSVASPMTPPMSARDGCGAFASSASPQQHLHDGLLKLSPIRVSLEHYMCRVIVVI